MRARLSLHARFKAREITHSGAGHSGPDHMSLRRDPSYLFASAAECRRLARDTPDEAAAKELLGLAAELEIEAGLQAALRFSAAMPERDAPLFTTADE